MMLPALDQLIDRHRAALEAEQASEAAMIADVVAHGGSVPTNHWQPRHRAEIRLAAALALREAFAFEDDAA